jgi:hypothetical protein
MSKYVINEDFLQQVESLQVILKNNLAGLFGGNHKSRTYGSSCEFADYRDYIPGDDITKIDWNAYARFDKLYLKLFLDERQVHTRIYIDASRSMDYGNGKKAEMALQIAATLAYLSICEMDRVSIYYIKENKVHEVISNIVGKESFYNSIGKLNEIEFSDDCFISDGILPTKVGYGDGMSIIISDFLTNNDYESAIDYLVGKRRDLICFQVLSKDELKPNIRGKVHFYDSENVEKQYRKNINRDIAKAYNEAVEYTVNRIKNYCNSRDANYLLVQSEKTVSELFLKTLPEMGVFK